LNPGSASLAGPSVVGQLLLQRDGVADLGRLELLDTSHDEADLASIEAISRHRLGREDTQVVSAVDRIAGHHAYAFTLDQRAVDHAHQHHHADVVVEPGINDHRAQRRIRIATRRRHAGDHRLEDVVDAHAGLRAARDRLIGVDADHVLDLRLRVLRVGIRQVHLVEDGNHLDAQIERGIAVGDGLRLDALARVNHEQRAFAGRQRTTHFIREIDMPRRVDQIQVVDTTIVRLVLKCCCLRLDRDAALALDVHRVEHLRFHLAIAQTSATLDQAIGERGLAMVDVGNDRKISDVVHADCECSSVELR
jgi:hypothetical protein